MYFCVASSVVAHSCAQEYSERVSHSPSTDVSSGSSTKRHVAAPASRGDRDQQSPGEKARLGHQPMALEKQQQRQMQQEHSIRPAPECLGRLPQLRSTDHRLSARGDDQSVADRAGQIAQHAERPRPDVQRVPDRIAQRQNDARRRSSRPPRDRVWTGGICAITMPSARYGSIAGSESRAIGPHPLV